jgi:hypothetical protein
MNLASIDLELFRSYLVSQLRNHWVRAAVAAGATETEADISFSAREIEFCRWLAGADFPSCNPTRFDGPGFIVTCDPSNNWLPDDERERIACEMREARERQLSTRLAP